MEFSFHVFLFAFFIIARATVALCSLDASRSYDLLKKIAFVFCSLESPNFSNFQFLLCSLSSQFAKMEFVLNPSCSNCVKWSLLIVESYNDRTAWMLIPSAFLYENTQTDPNIKTLHTTHNTYTHIYQRWYLAKLNQILKLKVKLKRTQYKIEYILVNSK